MDNNNEKALKFSETVKQLFHTKDRLYILSECGYRNNSEASKTIEEIKGLKETIAQERKGLSRNELKYASKLGLVDYRTSINNDSLKRSQPLNREESKLKKQRKALLNLLQQEADKSECTEL